MEKTKLPGIIVLCNALSMFITEQGVQVSDTTTADSNSKAGFIIISQTFFPGNPV